MPITIEAQRKAFADVQVSAARWWESKRPVSFTLADHQRSPAVGLPGLGEQDLARAVATGAAVPSVALVWWESRRPCAFTLQDHVDNPSVNVAGEAEQDLARKVATAVNIGAL